MNYNKLTPEQERVIIHKSTEPPFTGEYDNFYEDGVFICRRCNAPFFSSKSKFDAGCGWPSFDESFPNTIKHVPDPDETRTEIQCANSLSIRFVPKGKELPKIIHYVNNNKQH